MSELNGTMTISIPSLVFNYVGHRLESIDFGGDLYYRDRGAYDELEAERDDLKRKLEILKAHGVEIVDAVAGGFEIYNEAIHERDVWKTKCETREFAYKQADAERKRYSEQIDELRAELDELRGGTDGPKCSD